MLIEIRPEGEPSHSSKTALKWATGCKLLKLVELVGAIGFEPTTPCAQGRCATRLRYAPTEVAESILKYFPALLPLRIMISGFALANR
jgi:hypothetical protein